MTDRHHHRAAALALALACLATPAAAGHHSHFHSRCTPRVEYVRDAEGNVIRKRVIYPRSCYARVPADPRFQLRKTPRFKIRRFRLRRYRR